MPRPVHFEIHADNCERAVEFYTRVFGWNIKKWDGPMEYWMVLTGPKDQPGIDGGLLPRPCAAPADGQPMNSYVCTMNVDDVDTMAKTVTEAGGTIALPKMEVPGVGWLFYAKDTEGNVFGCMQFTAAPNPNC